VTIKVDLGTLKVLVDLMDLEWDFSMLMKEKILWALISTNTSILVDSVGPPSAEVCRIAASFP
jgi:hypothetical protein